MSALSTAALNCPVLGSAYPAGHIGHFQHLAGIMPQSFSQFRRSITCNLATLVMHIQSKLEEGRLQAQIAPLESTLAIHQQGSITQVASGPVSWTRVEGQKGHRLACGEQHLYVNYAKAKLSWGNWRADLSAERGRRARKATRRPPCARKSARQQPPETA